MEKRRMMASGAPVKPARIIIIIMLTLSLSSATTVKALPFHKLVYRANQLYDEGDYKKALSYAKQA